MQKPKLGVPLHRLVVHVPITMFMLVPVMDFAALFGGLQPWWSLALGASALGLVVGATAIVTGLIEYLHPSLVGINMRLAARHGIRTSLAWCMFMTKFAIGLLSPLSDRILMLCLMFDLIGCGLLMQGAYFGTKLVYEQFMED
ncbi:MAG TPA: DUF2231 domain-containing protein [Candidatus Acidoferrum sp.]|jgi:uncharacterized membrane protein|nr:DUF2231 domain-containing protein [Candidatus Acidoferrum sp.]